MTTPFKITAGAGMRPVAAILLAILLLAGCGEDTPRSAGELDTLGGSPADELDVASMTFSVYQLLRASGNQVEVKGVARQPGFDAEGRVLSLNGEDLQVFEFSSDDDVAEAAAKVGADGTTIDNRSVSWSGTPHFYKSRRIITIYAGDNPQTTTLLEAAIGPQFAGR
jgi:membrane-associated protease RseP (regulator of RpoE activity)